MRRRSTGRVIKNIIVVLVIIGLLGWVGIAIATQCGDSGGDIPGITEAPYRVNTPSRIYYTERYFEYDELIVLVGFYEQIDGKWQYREKPLALEKKAYHNAIEITPR